MDGVGEGWKVATGKVWQVPCLEGGWWRYWEVQEGGHGSYSWKEAKWEMWGRCRRRGGEEKDGVRARTKEEG